MWRGRAPTMFALALSVLALAAHSSASPAYRSLAGLSRAEIANIERSFPFVGAQPPPGPQNDTSPRLVNDIFHPFIPPGPFDQRGPCPGLNTLASHGWLPRNGIATPAQIIHAVQDGFNMKNDLALLVTYAAMLVDGNPLTNLLSIGGKTPGTGPDPPAPDKVVAGLDTHAVFEGDASMTRGDFFFGDNHSFNETLFEEFESFSNKFGNGKYNLTVAAELRHQRIQDSIGTNPSFSFVSPRYFTAFAESVFPIEFFVDGRVQDGQLGLTEARGFFEFQHMPHGFFRRNGSFGFAEIGGEVFALFKAHPILPGNNQGVNNFVLDPNSTSFQTPGNTFCNIYASFATEVVPRLYPSPTGRLRTALNGNLQNLFDAVQALGCTQVFPFGQ